MVCTKKRYLKKLDVPQGTRPTAARGILRKQPKASNRINNLPISKMSKLGGAYDDGAEHGTALLVTLLPPIAVAPLLFAA